MYILQVFPTGKSNVKKKWKKGKKEIKLQFVLFLLFPGWRRFPAKASNRSAPQFLDVAPSADKLQARTTLQT